MVLLFGLFIYCVTLIEEVFVKELNWCKPLVFLGLSIGLAAICYAVADAAEKWDDIEDQQQEQPR